MKKSSPLLSGGCLALFLVIALTGFARISSAESIFIFGRGGDSVGLDPAHEDDGESYKVCDNIYDTLVFHSFDNAKIVPALAESWEISDDGLTYTFKLRTDVKFHDGTVFDANAVLFSLNRQRQKDHPFHKVGGAWKYWQNMGMSDIVKDLRKDGDHTVVFELSRPEAPFLANLGMNFCAIVSPAAVRKYGEDYNFNPVGTGPFSFEKWDKDDQVVLRANPDYWGGKPGVDKLIFKSIPDNAARLIALQAGQIHGMDFPNPDELETIRKDPNLELATGAGLNVCYMAMHTGKKPFDDPKVRRAVNMALAKEPMIKALFGDLGMPAKNPMPPTMWGYNDDIEPVKYDMAAAKKLLAEAGYPKGFNTTLWYMPVPRPYLPDPKRLAQAIQANLKAIGINAELVTYEWGVYLDKTDNGEHDMALMGWSGDNGDPDNFLYILLDKTAATVPATNIAFYKSDEMHELLVAAKQKTTQAERADLYKKAQEVFARDLPWVPLAHMSQMVVLHKKVEGFQLHPLQKRIFKGVSLAK